MARQRFISYSHESHCNLKYLFVLHWKFWGFPGVPAAAAAVKSLQLCPTLCNPIEGSRPGSAVPGILQARVLEWVAIAFSTGGLSGKEFACQCRRCKRLRFNPWVWKIPWRRAWLLTPVFVLGESHGQRSLVGYRPWGCKESDMTEQLTLYFTYSELRRWH